MSVKTIRGNLLFWKITAVFTVLLVVLGVVYLIIESRMSRSYYTMAHQELYGNVAATSPVLPNPLKMANPIPA